MAGNNGENSENGMKTKPGPAASTDRPYARALELPSEQTARTSPQTQTTSLASSQLYPINMVVNGSKRKSVTAAISGERCMYVRQSFPVQTAITSQSKFSLKNDKRPALKQKNDATQPNRKRSCYTQGQNLTKQPKSYEELTLIDVVTSTNIHAVQPYSADRSFFESMLPSIRHFTENQRRDFQSGVLNLRDHINYSLHLLNLEYQPRPFNYDFQSRPFNCYEHRQYPFNDAFFPCPLNYENQPRPFNHEYQRRPSNHGGQPRPSNYGGQGQPCPFNHEYQLRLINHEYQSRPFNHEYQRRPSNYGGQPRPSNYGGQGQPCPFNHEYQSRPSNYEYQRRPSNYGGQPRPSNYGGQGQPCPFNHEYQLRLINHEYQSRPSNYGGQPRPSNHEYQSRPSNYGGQPRPSNHEYQSRPSNYGGQPRPSNHEYQSRPFNHEYQPRSFNRERTGNVSSLGFSFQLPRSGTPTSISTMNSTFSSSNEDMF